MDPAPEPSTEPQNSQSEANESFNHDAQPVCEDLDEELNPPDALSASSHETGPSDPLLAHGQQWETLQGCVMASMPRMAGVMLKQESGGRENWQRQSGMMRRHASTT